MTLQDLNNKLVAVLGFGQEGKAVTGYLLKHGIKPVLFDQKPWDEWEKDEQEKIKSLGINFIFGPDAFFELRGFDVAFRSPGIRLSQLTIDNLQLTSQTKFFFDNCLGKIIGITGTKGKGTTSALIYDMLCSAPIHRQPNTPINGHATPGAYLTGNIGKTQPLEILDDLKADDWIVYELSSFQLQDMETSPHIGVVLMLTSEHLDYHADQSEYIEAKSAITKFQSADNFAIVNADFENSVNIGNLGKGRKLIFSRKKTDTDCYVDHEQIIISHSNLKLPISRLQLKGAHNLENVMAAMLAARCAGCSDDAITSAASNFKGLEHRLEFVTEKNGIKFYNDSFSTTPETAIAAIQSFTEPEIVILGGSVKNSDFSELAKMVHQSTNIKSLILIGQEGPNLKAAIDLAGGTKAEILMAAKNMEQIFVQIKSAAQKGDIVLLSPACASFDMFKNYQDRGQQFKTFAMSF